MDTFKKIYMAIMAMTIISIILLCLNSLGIIDILQYTENGLDTSETRTFLIALSILIMSFVFSRSANVIANRKNTIIGYIAVFTGLIFLLGLDIVLIFKIQITGTLSSILKYAIKFLGLLTLLVLVFEVPQANTNHGRFQKLTALLITITFGYFIFNNNINNGKIGIVLCFTSLGAFLLNPMLRVYYIDKDYQQTDEIDDIINHAKADVVTAPNPEAVIENQKILLEKEKEKEISKPVPNVNQIVVEEPHEKVINPNFKQEDIPDAIIPSINTDNDTPGLSIEQTHSPDNKFLIFNQINEQQNVNDLPVIPNNQVITPQINNNIQTPEIVTPPNAEQQSNNQNTQ